MKSTIRIGIGTLLFIALATITWALSNNGLQAQTPREIQIQEVDALSKIEPMVLTQIEANERTEFFIWMTEKADLSPAYDLETKEKRGQFVFNTLRETATRTQAELLAEFDKSRVEYRAYYISNKILVYGGDQTLLMSIATRDDVAQITANHTIQLDEPIKSEVLAGPSPMAIESNITFINADDVWAAGYDGSGIVLAGNDTGLDETHPTIFPRYRGCQNPPTCSIIDHNYNWWDATNTYPNDPFDGHGHGTHTTGTMVGDDGGANQIGVAPGAQTVHCKNMTDSGGGSDITFSTCFEWDLAPWDLNGANPRPDLAPDAINNSWGYSGGGQTQFRDEIAALQAAGILVELSAGNSGPGCSSLGSPGDYQEVLTTGSVNHANGIMPGTITGFSSRGPSSLDGDYFPDIMAPGENIRSALPGNSYGSWGGTSMSGPHVTALVGLMWSAGPALRGNIVDTVDIIRNTAVPLIGQNGSSCGGDYTTGPNNDWGFGTIDALAAVQEAMLYGAVGTLNGTVTDSSNSSPIEGAMINATLSPTRTWSTATNATGVYTMTLITGTYHVAASAFGYLPAAVSNVEIVSGTTTVQDFALTPATIYTVDGYVTDVNTGWPLYANLDIDGYPGDAIWTDPVSGHYSISLPAGITYTFNVNAWVSSYMTENRDVGPLTANTTEDFALDADTTICTAPGYSENNIFYDGFESGALSAGWIVTTTVNGRVQVSTDDPYLGNYSVLLDSAVDSSYSNAGIILPIDLSSEPQVDLSFWWHEYSDEDDPEDGVFISDDNGVTWCQAFSFNGTTNNYQKAELDLTSIATGCSMTLGANSQILFRFYDNYRISTDGYTIDEVKLFAGTSVCQPPADGGLLVGNVYDDNTGDELNGAEVASDGGEAVATFATLADANLDDGFFTIFSPSGSHTFTATMSGGYGADVETLTIANGGTVSQPFNLPAGMLDATPDNFHVTLNMGDSVTNTLTLNNSGGLATDFEMRERGGSFVPILNLPVYTAPDITTNPSLGSSYSGGDSQIPSDSNNYEQAPDRYAGINALIYYGDRSTFNADNPGLPLENFGNTLVPPGVITGCPGPFNSATNDACFTPGGILGGISLASDPPGNMIVIGSGALGNPDVLVGPNSFASDHDIIFPNGDIYVVGFDLWSPNGAATVDIYIYGLGDVLLDQTSVVATATGAFWGVVSSELITRIHTNAPGGDGELFTNISFGEGVSDIPWLSEDPITGTVASLSSVNIEVTFDASVPEITQPGDYLAKLSVNNDSPYGNPTIPVTMTVLVPTSFGKLRGTVTGLGYCDVDPTILGDAEVLIEDSVGVTTTLITDAAGYYSYWLDEASGPVTVTVTAVEHESGMATDVAITGQVTTTVDVDLRWLQPCVSVAPDSLEATLDMGDSTVLTLDIDNTGSVATSFEIVEKSGGYIPTMVTFGPFEEASIVVPLAQQEQATTEGLDLPLAPVASPFAAGDVIQSWSVSQSAPWGIAYDPFNDSVWVGEGWGDNNIYEYATDGTPTGTSYPFTWGPSNGPADIAYNWNTGMLWSLDVGGDDCIHEIDPGSGVTGNTICPAFSVSQRGVTYDPSTDTYFAGGWNDLSIHHFTTDGTILSSVDVGLSIAGLAYNPETQHLFVQISGGSNDVYVLDASQPAYPSVGQFHIGTLAGGAGLEFDCDGNLWAVDQAADTVIQAESGESASLCDFDVPWLSEDPITGTLDADTGAQTIDVTFDAGVPEIGQPGVYYATLRVASDDPFAPFNVPVTMTVNTSADWGRLDGTVTGLGYCDADPAGLENAELFITDSGGVTYTLMTDANGYFSYWFDAAVSPLDIAVTFPEHTDGSATGIAITAGVTTTVDFDLRWLEPCVSTTPVALEVTLLQGDSAILNLDINNAGATSTTFKLQEKEGGFVTPTMMSLYSGGTIEWLYRNTDGINVETSDSGATVVYPGAYRYVPNNPTASNILVYTDDWVHTAPNTLVQDALANLGLAATVHVDGDYAGFQTALNTGGPWDLVIWSGENNVPDSSVFVDLNTYLQGGGKLAATYWRQLDIPTDPLWTEMGFTYISNYVAPPPVYWWDSGHALFNNPEEAPEWLNRDQNSGTSQGTRLEPLANGLAMAGYTVTPASNDAGIILRDDGMALYKGLRDVSTSADEDMDGILDGTELWMNIMVGMLDGFGGTDILWLSENPITGTVDADAIASIDVTFDTMTYTLGTYTGTLMIKSHDPVNRTIEVPVTMYIVDVITRSVDLSGDDALSSDSGDVITYTLSVTNSGNIADTFEIRISDAWGASAPFSITLNAGVTGTFDVAVPVPAGAMAGEFDVTTVSVTSVVSPTTSNDSTDLTTTANAYYGVDLSGDDALSDEVGTTVTYTLSITNTGNDTDTFTIALTDTWGASAPVSILLDAGATDTFDVAVPIPTGAAVGSSDVATVTVTSVGNAMRSDSADLTTTVDPSYGVDLSGDDALSGVVGMAVTYTLRITNTGNVADTFALTAYSINGWATALSDASVMLNAGEGVDVTVTVDILAAAADGDFDIATVTATSQGDGTKTAVSTLTTTAELIYIYLPVILKQ